MSFAKLSEIVEVAKKQNLLFWEVILQEDVRERNCTPEESFCKMQGMLTAMKQADEAYNPNLKSMSGMAGGDGLKLEKYRQSGKGFMGDFLSNVMEKAVKMAESNACMKRIVAAPTAGSCGVIPAVLLSYEKINQTEEQKLVQALFVAAGIGEVLATSASISGAEGGCQAEIGSAAAMAAGALAFLEGGDNETILHAAALALKNMLGLTCDPVAGLVEVPCIKRNVFGAVNAVTATQMAMAGIRSAVEPDEVIDSMRRIGKLMPECLKETSKEGLATTTLATLVEKRMQ